MSQPAETIQQRVRFEEVTPANTAAAFLDASIDSLVAPLGLPIYDGYDGLDELQLTFLTLPSGETVTLASYLNSPQPGTSIHVDSAMQNIPQVVFESCQQLQVSREEVLWFNPDWQEEIEGLYAEHGSIGQSQRYANEKRQESSRVEELSQQNQYEPIDCFNHALRIYTREYIPATYWAMLQHNLGLAYQNRSQGDRRENLERSIECFNKSSEIYTQDEFPDRWKINQADLSESYQYLRLPKGELIQDIIKNNVKHRKLRNADLKDADLRGAYLKGADLRCADLSNANLSGIKLSVRGLNQSPTIFPGHNWRIHNHTRRNTIRINKQRGSDLIRVVNLSDANLSGANLSRANLRGANLSNANLSGTNVENTLFGNNLGISKALRQELIIRKAIFDDSSPGDRSESKSLVPR
jgi:uncharacterized protein YjbI with pentapeptide repeats